MQGKEGERSRRGKGSHGGVKVAATFFFWVILIFSHLSFSSAAKVLHRNGRLYRQSPPRKARFVDTKTASFHAPLSPANSINGASDPDILYGDDKRLVHTGPNPLHN
ncbi:hypothetical protein L484_022931 [Morus notabilis]|uniref:CLAVATA3/ESR (CLE)-related protein 16 n=1 Tax=Morus notabilis TaxID=981085 RepID=W9QTS0_9ROSA|nr:hypothetical protein L484_022931 [Morus notabilis]